MTTSGHNAPVPCSCRPTEVLRTSLVYEVRVLVDDPDDVLRLGQPVTVRLESGTADRKHEAG